MATHFFWFCLGVIFGFGWGVLAWIWVMKGENKKPLTDSDKSNNHYIA